MSFADPPPTRPPCSEAERDTATALAGEFATLGLQPHLQLLTAPSSATWAPLFRAVARIWGAALLAASWPLPAAALAAVSVIGSLPPMAASLRFLPVVGGIAQNVFVHVPGTSTDLRPLVVAAHLDTHPNNGAPLRRPHSLLTAVSSLLLLWSALSGRPDALAIGWGTVAALVVTESVATLIVLARVELRRLDSQPDDNTSGLHTLHRTAQLLGESAPLRDVWLVGTAAGLSGGHGMRAFLEQHPDVRRAWVIEVDALGGAEVIACPYPARFPFPGTPPALVRALSDAAAARGDPIAVRRVRRPHADARAALRRRTGAISLTAGIPHPVAAEGPDLPNAMRAANLIDQLAHTG